MHANQSLPNGRDEPRLAAKKLTMKRILYNIRKLASAARRWLWRGVRPAPLVSLTDLKCEGMESCTVTCWADGDEDRKQTVFVTPRAKPLQLSPKVKDL